jgi:hypothetical protein
MSIGEEMSPRAPSIVVFKSAQDHEADRFQLNNERSVSAA